MQIYHIYIYIFIIIQYYSYMHCLLYESFNSYHHDAIPWSQLFLVGQMLGPGCRPPWRSELTWWAQTWSEMHVNHTNLEVVAFRKLKYWTLFGESAQSTKRFLPSFLLVGLAHNGAHKTPCKLKPSPCKEASKFQHKYSSCRVLRHTTSLHQTMKSVKLQVHAQLHLVRSRLTKHIAC